MYFMEKDIARRASESANARGIVGHFSLDLVTFIHPSTVRHNYYFFFFKLLTTLIF